MASRHHRLEPRADLWKPICWLVTAVSLIAALFAVLTFSDVSTVSDNSIDGKRDGAAASPVTANLPGSNYTSSDEVWSQPAQEHALGEQRKKAGPARDDLMLARLEIDRLQIGTAKSRQAAVASLEQTKQALEKERQKSWRLARDLAAARGSVTALQAKVEPAAAAQAADIKSRHAAEASLKKTRGALEEERQKRGLLERDLGAAHGSIEALQAKVEPAAAERANAIKARQAAEASLEKTRQALETERQKAGLLERDLAAARESIEKLQPAAAAQAAAVKSRQAAEAPLAETRQALETEQQKAGLLERDLAAARELIEKLQPAATEQAAAVKSRQAAEASLAETRQALEAERQKSGLLERDLAAARGSIEKLQPAAAEQAAAVKNRQASEASLAETRQALEEERQKIGFLERGFAAARVTIDALEAKVEPAAANQAAAVKSRQAAEASLAQTRRSARGGAAKEHAPRARSCCGARVYRQP